MSEIANRYERIADAFSARIEAVPPGSWGKQSPCSEWTAHDVARHVVDTTRMLLTRVTGGDPTPPDADEDVVSAWRVESAAVKAALVDPERATSMVKGMGGEQPFEELIGTVLCADTLIHTWDLARATDQYDTLDPAGIEAAQAFLEPHEQMLRQSGNFAARIDPPEGTDEQAKFLCFVGRQP